MSPMILSFCFIGFAGLLGSVIGTFSGRPLVSMIWSLPLLAGFQASATFVAAHVQRNAGIPPGLRDAITAFSEPSLLFQILIACAIGTGAASLMVRQLERSRTTPFWLPHLDEQASGARARARAAKPTAKTALGERIAAAGGPRPEFQPRPSGPLPVLDIAPSAPITLDPQPASEVEPLSPEPAPAPAQALSGPEKRSQARRKTILAGRVVREDETSSPCTIHSLSLDGAQLGFASAVPLPKQFWLIDMSNAVGHDAELAWSRGARAGVRLTASYDLRNPQSSRAKALSAHRAAFGP